MCLFHTRRTYVVHYFKPRFFTSLYFLLLHGFSYVIFYATNSCKVLCQILNIKQWILLNFDCLQLFTTIHYLLYGNKWLVRALYVLGITHYILEYNREKKANFSPENLYPTYKDKSNQYNTTWYIRWRIILKTKYGRKLGEMRDDPIFSFRRPRWRFFSIDVKEAKKSTIKKE